MVYSTIKNYQYETITGTLRNNSVVMELLKNYGCTCVVELVRSDVVDVISRKIYLDKLITERKQKKHQSEISTLKSRIIQEGFDPNQIWTEDQLNAKLLERTRFYSLWQDLDSGSIKFLDEKTFTLLKKSLPPIQ